MRDGKAHPRLFRLAAAALRRRGALDEAVVFLKHGLTLDEADDAMWLMLGVCLVRLGRPVQAAEALAHGAAAAPANADIAYALGEVWAHLGDPAKARAGYRKSLELDPRRTDAYAGLATLEVRLGDTGEARRLAEAALALAPSNPIALSALADVAVREKRWADAAGLAQQVLDTPTAQRLTRSVAAALLGEARHGQGDAAAAMAGWASAKSLFVQTNAEHWRGPAELRLAALRRWAEALEAQAPVEALPPPASPAFLMGFLRSGTTLAGQMIAGCPGVTVLDERHTLGAAAGLLHRPDAPAAVAALDEAAVETLRLSYWRSAEGFGLIPGARLVDKMPLHAVHLPIIARMFPGARVVVVRRDPRDVVLSCFRRMFRPNADTIQFGDLHGVATLYDGVMRLTEAAAMRLGLNLQSVRYEDLVREPEAATRSLAEFLGLDWTPAMLAFAERPRPPDVQTPSAVQLAAGLFDGSGQWRPYAEALAPVLPRLKPWIRKFGYEA